MHDSVSDYAATYTKVCARVSIRRSNKMEDGRLGVGHPIVGVGDGRWDPVTRVLVFHDMSSVSGLPCPMAWMWRMASVH
jgi:hypothetical protein